MEGQKWCVNEVINSKKSLGLTMQGPISCKRRKFGIFSYPFVFPHSIKNLRETEGFPHLCVAIQFWVCKGCFNVVGVLLGLGQFSFNSLLCHRLPVSIQGNRTSAFLWLGLPRSRWEIKAFIYCTVMTGKETPLTLERRGRRPDWQMYIVADWLRFTNTLPNFNLSD